MRVLYLILFLVFFSTTSYGNCKIIPRDRLIVFFSDAPREEKELEFYRSGYCDLSLKYSRDLVVRGLYDDSDFSGGIKVRYRGSIDRFDNSSSELIKIYSKDSGSLLQTLVVLFLPDKDYPAPVAPPSPKVERTDCDGVVLSVEGDAPNGVQWFWQYENNGESFEEPFLSNRSIHVSRSGRYYLRSRAIFDPNGKVNNFGRWSKTSSFVDVDIEKLRKKATVWYEDKDGDGLGDPKVSQKSCEQPIGYVSNMRDLCPSENGNGSSTGCNEGFQECIEKGDNYVVDKSRGKIRLTARNCIVFSPNTWLKSGSDFHAYIDRNGYMGYHLSKDENYIFSREFQVATATGEVSRATDVQDQVCYYDGLGRLKQTVLLKAGGDFEDIVYPIYYDGFGRKSRVYLPYSEESSADLSGSYRPKGFLSSETYYTSHYAKEINPSSPNPYVAKDFETSSLNRVLRESSPGQTWQLGSGHEIKYVYSSNKKNEVRIYSVSLKLSGKTYFPTLVGGVDYYASGSLYKHIVRDESWTPESGNLHSMEEFKDKLGHVILKRRYAKVGGVVSSHDTYYVYDSYGNLTYVLPPKSDAGLRKPNESILSALCYQYVYDHRNRIVEKQLPGKGREYIVYNKSNNPVLTKDSKNGWVFTKYDVLGRVVYTGLASTTSSREDLQSVVDNSEVSYEHRQSNLTSLGDNGSVYYSNNSVPTGIKKLYSVHYYDKYIPFSNGMSNQMTIYGEKSTMATQGLPLVQISRILGTNTWKTEVSYYDKKGRSFGLHRTNSYLGTSDIVKRKLDFVGRIKQSTHVHKRGNRSITMVDDYSYDHMGRLLTHTQSLDSHSPEMLASNRYDDLGKLKDKSVGGNVNLPGLQRIDYSYNIRGWLSGINDTKHLGSDLFALSLNYNAPLHGGNPLYNGNISELSYRTQSDNKLRYYEYTYDCLNRLKSAIDDSKQYSLRGVTYDKNGNITGLERLGHLNKEGTKFGLMDKLLYTYDAGNRLQKVEDSGNKSYGFRDVSLGQVDYRYDVNGNLEFDLNKGIRRIVYNELDLPTTIDIKGSQVSKISYLYSSDGEKQRSMVKTNGVVNTMDYCGAFVYRNGKLEFIRTAEGYASVVTGGYRYVYEYKDHLGSNRLSYTDANGDGKVSKDEIITETNYYPFGLEHRGYNIEVRSTGNLTAQRYKYNGKEYFEDLGLDWYDYGARNYEASLGRWMNIDPLAEKYPSVSSYCYTLNNPVRFIDPTGMEIEEGSLKEWGSLMQQIEEQRDRIQSKIDELNAKAESKGWSSEKLAGKIGNKAKRLASLNSSLGTMGTLEASTQVYSLSHTEYGENGGVTLNTNVVDIKFGGTANFVHEMTHAGQFETRDIAFSNTGMSLLQDVYDEVAAYKAQFGYSPSSVSGLTSISVANSFGAITPAWVQGLRDAIGSMPYAVGGTANTGLIPININSTRDALIQAYPWNAAAFRRLPANYIIRTLQGIYYKE